MLPRRCGGHDPAGRAQHVEVALQIEVEHAIELVVLIVEDLLAHVDARRADRRRRGCRARRERRRTPRRRPRRRGCRAPPASHCQPCRRALARPRARPASALTSRQVTRGAGAAAPSATASPMPEPPPTTATTFPDKSKMSAEPDITSPTGAGWTRPANVTTACRDRPRRTRPTSTGSTQRKAGVMTSHASSVRPARRRSTPAPPRVVIRARRARRRWARRT